MTSAIFNALTAQTQDLIETLRRSVVLVRGGDGHGAGVVWDRQGLIVTNDHVARGDRAEVELSDGRRLAARTLARDRENDLALLRVSAQIRPISARTCRRLPGDSQALQVGETDSRRRPSLGRAAKRPRWASSAAAGPGTWLGRTRREMLQADVALAPGNSGGPLADAQGRVVGIASMVMSPGIALAVPTHVAQQFVETALAHVYRRAA